MSTDSKPAPTRIPGKALDLKTIGMIVLPIVLLVGVIAIFLVSNGAGLHVQPVVPQESLTFDQTILHPDDFELHIRNTSPQDITIAAVNVNDAIMPFEAAPSATIPHLGQADDSSALCVGARRGLRDQTDHLELDCL